MGTDSSGFPLCEPGTHDHGGSAFVPVTRGLQFCLFPSMLLRCGRAGERGKVFRNHFAATTSFQNSGYAIYYSRKVIRNHKKVVTRGCYPYCLIT